MALAKNYTSASSITSKIKPLALTGGILVCYFFVAKAVFASFGAQSPAGTIFGILLLLAETYILMHTLGYLSNIFASSDGARAEGAEAPGMGLAPSVAVVVVARHEPKEVLESTLFSITHLNYPNKKVYLLDDSTDRKFVLEADSLCARFGVHLFRRDARHGAKAGILNDFLMTIDEKYMAVFDADLNPVPEFMTKLVPIMEKDEKLAFIQAPQYSSNLSDNPVAAGSAVQQAVFYEDVCGRKSANNAMFCCGTNVLFRRGALLSVGGFDESSITEDFATSVRLHLKGYSSLYYGGVRAYGLAPETLTAYFKQQTRWAAGTVSVFSGLVLRFITNPGSLNALQWWEYFLSGTYYFVGWAFFSFMLCPVAYLLFGVPSFLQNAWVYAAAFIPCFLLTMLVLSPSGKVTKFKLTDLYRGTMLGLLGFPILMKAAVYGLLNIKMEFEVTSKSGSKAMPLLSLWPWMLIAAVNLCGFFEGIRDISATGFSVASGASVLWVLYNIFVILNIFYFNSAAEQEQEVVRDMNAAELADERLRI